MSSGAVAVRPVWPRAHRRPSRQSTRHGRRAFGTTSLLLAAATTAISSAWAASTEQGIGAGAVSLTLLCVALARWVATPRSLRAALSEGNIATWVLAYAAVAFGISTISILTDKGAPSSVVQLGDVRGSLLVVAVGFVAMASGDRLASRAWPRRGGTRRANPTRQTSLLLLVYIAGIAATLARSRIDGTFGFLGDRELSQSSSVSELSQPLNIVAFLRTAAIVGLSSRHATFRRKTDLAVLTAIVGFEIALGLTSGLKETFIVVCFAVAAPRMLRSGKLPAASLTIALAVFITFVTPFVTSLRQEVRSGSERMSLAGALDLATSRLTGGQVSGDDDGGLGNTAIQLASRIRLIDNVVAIRGQTPSDIPFRDLDEVFSAPLSGIVPRALWPSKPLRLTGLEFYQQYFHGTSYSASAVTTQGSLLMYGGVSVLILGMTLLGMASHRLSVLIRKLSAERASIILLLTFVSLVKQELGFADLMAAVPIWVLTYLLASRVVTRPTSPFNKELSLE